MAAATRILFIIPLLFTSKPARLLLFNAGSFWQCFGFSQPAFALIYNFRFFVGTGRQLNGILVYQLH